MEPSPCTVQLDPAAGAPDPATAVPDPRPPSPSSTPPSARLTALRPASHVPETTRRRGMAPPAILAPRMVVRR
uniref:Uncharacterized protein n=1 Tax=Oryza meridionalis TaxID=40149 RepID=A0A0E0DBC7_9ORYZ